MIRVFLLTIATLTLSFSQMNSIYGKDVYRTSDDKRISAWNIGINGYQHALRSGDGNNFVGASSAVELGYTHIGHSWLGMLNLNVISGPYLSPQQQDTRLDYSGTGVTILYAASAENADIRSYNGNYGFGIGLHYLDIIGRVVGDRFDPTGRTDKLVMRFTNFAVMPTIFFNWLHPSVRKVSNHPDDLNTRVEGYHLNIGFLVPLIANYTLRYEELNSNGDSIPVKEKGDLFGFSVVITFTAMLGV